MQTVLVQVVLPALEGPGFWTVETHPTCLSCITRIGLRSHSLSRAHFQLLCPQTLQGGTRFWIPGCTHTAHTQLLLTGQWASDLVPRAVCKPRQRLQPPHFGLSWLSYRETGVNRPEVAALWGVSPPCSSSTQSGFQGAGICTLERFRSSPLRFSVLVTNFLELVEKWFLLLCQEHFPTHPSNLSRLQLPIISGSMTMDSVQISKHNCNICAAHSGT